KLSAESPEFIPQSVCSKNKNVKKTDKLKKNNKTPRGNQRGWNGYPKLDGYHFPYSLNEKWLVHSKRLMWLVQEGTALGKDLLKSVDGCQVKTFSNPLYGCDGLPKTVRVFQFTLDSRSEKLDWLLLHQDWKLLLRDVAASFDSAVHRVHAVSFDAAVASTVSAACCVAAAYFVPAAPQSSYFEKIYLETWN
ncbi:hypothetical protein Tco_0133788, partial [Tanacetum coccineum]